jgi:DNA-binding response OmpR family regulator
MTRILLVDDDESFRRMLHLTLVRAGYDVVDAGDGNKALKLFRAQPPDLVLTDLIMPDREGLETIMELRSIQPDVKIIAMSGGGRSRPGDYLKVARQMGAARVLAKPFSNQELLDAVRAVIAPAEERLALAGESSAVG